MVDRQIRRCRVHSLEPDCDTFLLSALLASKFLPKLLFYIVSVYSSPLMHPFGRMMIKFIRLFA